MGLIPADDFTRWLTSLIHNIEKFSHLKVPFLIYHSSFFNPI